MKTVSTLLLASFLLMIPFVSAVAAEDGLPTTGPATDSDSFSTLTDIPAEAMAADELDIVKGKTIPTLGFTVGDEVVAVTFRIGPCETLCGTIFTINGITRADTTSYPTIPNKPIFINGGIANDFR